jgi:endonuclease III
MQTTFSFGQTADLRAILNRLRNRFGPLPERPRLDPVSQFVRAFIGTRTLDAKARAAFDRLRGRFADWDALADAEVAVIEAALGDVTFADAKALNLKLALQKIRVRAGALSLDFLATLDIGTAHLWLEQIHGVGRTIAAAVLNRSTLGRRTFVVDSHGQRVLQRLGVAKPNATIEATHEAVMAAADSLGAAELFELNWYVKTLGYKTCLRPRPLCEVCPLSQSCALRRAAENASSKRNNVRQPSHAA